MRVRGLEPPRVAPLGPKPSASANSATPARRAGPSGVNGGTRTLGRLDHNQELYQLSYVHRGHRRTTVWAIIVHASPCSTGAQKSGLARRSRRSASATWCSSQPTRSISCARSVKSRSGFSARHSLSAARPISLRSDAPAIRCELHPGMSRPHLGLVAPRWSGCRAAPLDGARRSVADRRRRDPHGRRAHDHQRGGSRRGNSRHRHRSPGKGPQCRLLGGHRGDRAGCQDDHCNREVFDAHFQPPGTKTLDMGSIGGCRRYLETVM